MLLEGPILQIPRDDFRLFKPFLIMANFSPLNLILWFHFLHYFPFLGKKLFNDLVFSLNTFFTILKKITKRTWISP